MRSGECDLTSNRFSIPTLPSSAVTPKEQCALYGYDDKFIENSILALRLRRRPALVPYAGSICAQSIMSTLKPLRTFVGTIV